MTSPPKPFIGPGQTLWLLTIIFAGLLLSDVQGVLARLITLYIALVILLSLVRQQLRYDKHA